MRRAIALVSLVAALLVAPSAAADEPAAPAAAPAEAPPAPRREPLLVIERRPSVEPPEGSASPATAAGTTGLHVQLGLEAFVAYAVKVTPTAASTEWFHTFEVPRAHASMAGEYGPVQARLVLEAVRSASEGALMGVAGDSFVMRLREASAGYRLGGWLAVDAGVVPTLTIPELDGTFNLRAVAATPAESAGLASPADLGATARVSFPKGFGWAAVGAYNGEGYAGRELNRGKNLEGALSVHPFATTAARPLALFGSLVIGSSGTGSARAHRLTTALLWQGRRLRAGVDFVYAWGVGEDGRLRSYLIDGFVRAEPIDRLLLGARAFTWLRDASAGRSRVTEITGAVGYRIAEPLEAFLSLGRGLAGAEAAAALPGIDRWEARLIARVVF